MKLKEILTLYDSSYAASYDYKFLASGYFKHTADVEAEILRELMTVGTRWLDVACGTGAALSRFPGFPRAGLDISPAMLERARLQNPDALFFREGDMRDPLPEWKDQWDIISSTWWAYCYLDSMGEARTLIKNLAEWTSSRGVCFVPVTDCEDITGGSSIPYRVPQAPDGPVAPLGGPFYITGFTWSWTENDDHRKHENLIAPHIDYLVDLFKEHFDVVEIVYYPPYLPGWRSRRAILATQKIGAAPTPMSRTVAALAAVYQPVVEQVNSNAFPIQTTSPDVLSTASIEPRRTGWLRRAWRRLPPRIRRIVKAAIGEP